MSSASLDQRRVAAAAEELMSKILRAATSWSEDAPVELTPHIRAVCIRLAEMVSDQRHYLAPLPEPRESERRAVLTAVADLLRTGPVACELRAQLDELTARELRATGSWSLIPTATTEWQQTAVDYLTDLAGRIAPDSGLDAWWAEDVVGGIIASIKGVIGADDLHTRIESQYAGGGRPRNRRDD